MSKFHIHRLKKSAFFRSVTVLISGNISAQVITLITMPIVSRIYSVQAFGEFAIFSSTAGIIGGISALGIGSAIMAPKDDAKAKDVFYTAFVTMLTISTIFLFFSLLLSSFHKFYNISIPYYRACFLLYFLLVLSGFSSILSIYANRLRQDRLLFWNILISALATLCVTVPLGLLGWGVGGFIMAAICANLFANFQMLLRINPFCRTLTIKQMISTFKEFKEYVYFQAPSNFLTVFSVQLPNQMFSTYFGNLALGSYSMCERVMGYPVRLIAAPIATIYFRHAAHFVNENKVADLGNFSLNLINKILLFAFIPTVLFMGFSERVFIFVLGERWGQAGTIAAILAINYVFLFCNQCLSYCLVVLNRQKVNLYFSLLQFVVIVVSIVSGMFFFKSFFLGTILVFGISNVFVQIICLSFSFFYLQMNLSIFLRSVLLFVGATLLLSAGIRILF